MRVGMIDTQAIRKRWDTVGSQLDERGQRVFASGEVRAAGWGGLDAVHEITGLARSTIGRGLKDLDAAPLPKGRVRRKGGGRRHLSFGDGTLIEDLRRIVEPVTLGCPVRPLLWVSKSHDKLAVALQKMGHKISPNATGLVIHVHHYPPGTSKWNKIEHRLFCHITQTWRGRPLTDRLAVVELIAATTTKTGLKVESALDTRTYEKGIKVSDAEMKTLDINGDPFHPEWNYTIRPRSSENRSG